MSKLKKQLTTVALSVLMVFALIGMAIVSMPVAKAADDEQVTAWLDTVVGAADADEDKKLTDDELGDILETMDTATALAIFNIGNSGDLTFADATKKANFDKIRVFFREPNNLIANNAKLTANYRNNLMTYDEFKEIDGWSKVYNAKEVVNEAEYEYTYKFRAFVNYNTNDLDNVKLALDKLAEIYTKIQAAEDAINAIKEYEGIDLVSASYGVIENKVEINVEGEGGFEGEGFYIYNDDGELKKVDEVTEGAFYIHKDEVSYYITEEVIVEGAGWYVYDEETETWVEADEETEGDRQAELVKEYYTDQTTDDLLNSKTLLDAAQDALDSIYGSVVYSETGDRTAIRPFATATKGKSIDYDDVFEERYNYFLGAVERYKAFVKEAEDLNEAILKLYNEKYLDVEAKEATETTPAVEAREGLRISIKKDVIDLETKYNGLDAQQQNIVTAVTEDNLIETMKQGIAAEEALVATVKGQIDAIGTVHYTAESKTLIDYARNGQKDGENVVGGYKNLRADTKAFIDEVNEAEEGEEDKIVEYPLPHNYKTLVAAEEKYAEYVKMYNDTLAAIDTVYESGTNNFKNNFTAAQKKYVALTTSTEKNNFLAALQNEKTADNTVFNKVAVDNYNDLYLEMANKNSENLRASEEAVQLINQLADDVDSVKVYLTVEYTEKLDAANAAYAKATEGGYAEYIGNANVLEKANELYDAAVVAADKWLEQVKAIIRVMTIKEYNEETDEFEEVPYTMTEIDEETGEETEVEVYEVIRELSKDIFGKFLAAYTSGKALLEYVPYDEENKTYSIYDLIEKYTEGYDRLTEYSDFAYETLNEIKVAVDEVLAFEKVEYAQGAKIIAVQRLVENNKYEDGVDDDAAVLMGETFKIKYSTFKKAETDYAEYVNTMNGYILTIAKLINHTDKGEMGEITDDMLKGGVIGYLDEIGELLGINFVIVDDTETDAEEGGADTPAETVEVKTSELNKIIERIKATIYGDTIDYEAYTLYYNTATGGELKSVAENIVKNLNVKALTEVTKDADMYVVDVETAREVADFISKLTVDTEYFAKVVDALNTVINNSDLTVEYVNNKMATASTELETLDAIEKVYTSLHLSQREEINRLENSNRQTFLTALNTARFNEQFAGLSETLKAIESAIKGESEEYAEEDLYTQIAAIKEQLAELENGGYDDTELKNRVAALETAVAALHNYDDTAITERVTALEGKVTTLETTVKTLATKTELEAAKTDLATAKTDLAAAKAELATLKETATTLATKTELEALAARVATVETNVTTLESRISALETSDETQNGKIAALEKALADANAALEKANADRDAADKANEDAIKGVQGYCTGLLIALIVTFLVAACGVVLVFLFKKKA